MKIYIKTDDTSKATGAYLSFTDRTRQGHIPVKEVEIPTEEEIEDEARKHSNRAQFESDFPHDYYSEFSGFTACAKWLISKLK